MNNELYATMKLCLLKYDFDQSTTFNELWHFSRQYNHNKPFKQFTKIVQNMGVTSHVARNGDGKLTRSLSYDPTADKYLAGKITILVPCPDCKGTGVVSAPVKITKTK